MFGVTQIQFISYKFIQPCVSMETAVMDAIDKFVAADVLNVCEVCAQCFYYFANVFISAL